MRVRSLLCGFAVFYFAAAALGATLQVGPGQTYAKPCAAFAAAKPGDTVEISATGNGTYDGDVCAIAASNLTIRGIGGRAHIDAIGMSAQGKAIWVVQGQNTTIENIEFSGATVTDMNGAGIRQEGANLTVRNCYFHDNEDGILTGADPTSEIVIESSEFARNGAGDGYSHNMYIGHIKKFTLRYSYSHSAKVGHLVKSRAEENDILYNRLTGESDGTESYEINLPNAGTSYIVGNLVQQGPTTQNSAMLDYGSEGASNAGNDLYVVNNTFVNERTSGATFVSVSSGGAVAAVIKNNIFVGTGTAISQANSVQAGNFASGNPMLVDSANFDYHLAPGSPCIDAGVDPGSAASGFSLLPQAQYVQPASFEGRQIVGKIDIGAYEFNGGTGVADAGLPQGGSGSGGSGQGGAQGAAGNIGGNGFDAGTSGAASASPTAGSCSCRVTHRQGFTGPLVVLGILLLLARRLPRTHRLLRHQVRPALIIPWSNKFLGGAFLNLIRKGARTRTPAPVRGASVSTDRYH